jgi:hypothetical protein
MRWFFVLVLGLTLPASALAQDDRVTFGSGTRVLAGESVNDVVTFGGDAAIDGEVRGDVATFGGDVTVSGHVAGDLVTFGGNAELLPGASVGGEITTMGGTLRGNGASSAPIVVPVSVPRAPDSPLDALAAFLQHALEGAASFALLFLLGLGMMGLFPDRMRSLEVVIAREPLAVGWRGAAGVFFAVVGAILLAITLIGIPAAIALMVGLSVATYVGLAAVAAVIGVVLPVERLRDRPVLQLAAGVATLYVASLVPGVGGLALIFAALVGLGAVVRTRLGKEVPPRFSDESSPYRGSAYPEAI